ncbi:unnamed protein product, partial [Iphiclides podalirius]
MRLYALLFALAVCRTRAATIPSEGVEPPTIAQPVDVKEPIEQSNVENNVRNAPDTIPVAIVEEPAQPKLDENSNDYIPSDDEQSVIIKRVEIDLNNPGPPQRQQHETQNPETYAERDYFVADIKQKLLDTENVFKKSVSDVNESFENWVPNSAHLTAIQNDIKEMQNKFLAQLSELNQSLQSYLNPQSTKSVVSDPKSVANLKEVETRLKDLEVNFKAGVQTLSEGVKVLESAKADGDATSTAEKPSETGSPSPAPSNPTNEQPPNPLGQVFQYFSDAIGQAINQMQNTFNSFTNQNNQQGTSESPPAGAQSDEGASTSKPPSFWETIQQQFNQMFNFGQSNPSSQTSQTPSTNPLLSLFNSNPIFQNFLNQGRPSTTPSSPTTAEVKPWSDEPPKAVEPQVAPAKAEEKPQQLQPQASDIPAAQTGPIREIVQNNPIVKGIVQRIQSISSPEKPREKKPEQVPELVKSEDTIKNKEPVSATKGHVFYGGHGGSGGDNGIDGIVVKSLANEEKIEEFPPKLEQKKDAELAKEEEEEKETVLLPDKTE